MTGLNINRNEFINIDQFSSGSIDKDDIGDKIKDKINSEMQSLEVEGPSKRKSVESPSKQKLDINLSKTFNTILSAINTLFLSLVRKPVLEGIYRDATKQSITLKAMERKEFPKIKVDFENLGNMRALLTTLGGRGAGSWPTSYDLTEAMDKLIKNMDVVDNIASMLVDGKETQSFYVNASGSASPILLPNYFECKFSIETKGTAENEKILVRVEPDFSSAYNVTKETNFETVDGSKVNVGQWFKEAGTQTFEIDKTVFLQSFKSQCEAKSILAPNIVK